MGLYCGEVGLYCGDVGLYCGEVGLYCGEVGLYCGLVGEYCGEVGLYCGEVGLYWGLVGLRSRKGQSRGAGSRGWAQPRARLRSRRRHASSLLMLPLPNMQHRNAGRNAARGSGRLMKAANKRAHE